MRGFKTAKSVYYVDTINRLIWGGKLGNTPKRYAPGAQFMIGSHGIAYFVDEYGRQLYTSDGRPAMIQTGIIRDYI